VEAEKRVSLLADSALAAVALRALAADSRVPVVVDLVAVALRAQAVEDLEVVDLEVLVRVDLAVLGALPADSQADSVRRAPGEDPASVRPRLLLQ